MNTHLPTDDSGFISADKSFCFPLHAFKSKKTSSKFKALSLGLSVWLLFSGNIVLSQTASKTSETSATDRKESEALWKNEPFGNRDLSKELVEILKMI